MVRQLEDAGNHREIDHLMQEPLDNQKVEGPVATRWRQLIEPLVSLLGHRILEVADVEAFDHECRLVVVLGSVGSRRFPELRHIIDPFFIDLIFFRVLVALGLDNLFLLIFIVVLFILVRSVYATEPKIVFLPLLVGFYDDFGLLVEIGVVTGFVYFVQGVSTDLDLLFELLKFQFEDLVHVGGAHVLNWLEIGALFVVGGFLALHLGRLSLKYGSHSSENAVLLPAIRILIGPLLLAPLLQFGLLRQLFLIIFFPNLFRLFVDDGLQLLGALLEHNKNFK